MAEPIACVWKERNTVSASDSTGDCSLLYDQSLDPLGDRSWDLQLVIRPLFRAIQGIEVLSSLSPIAVLGSHVGDPRRISQPCRSLDAGALQTTSMPAGRCRARWRSFPCCSTKDMAMAVDIKSSLSSDLISLRSMPGPTARTDQLQPTGALTIEPDPDTDRSGPAAEGAIPIWPRVYPGL
jgi:hypothetical protein